MTIRHLYPAVEPSLNLDFANSKKLDSRITFTRASTGTYTDESGIIRTAADNEARFDHDGDGNSLGLLIEQSRTNYVTTSEDLTGWSNATLGDGVNPTVQNVSATVPNNGSTVTEITLERGTASTSNYSIYRNQFGTTAVSTGSMYFKAARPQDVGKVIDFYHNQGAPQDFASVTLTNAWQRVSSVGVGGAAGYLSIALFNSTASTGEVKVLAWGAQVEEGSFPTSYIPTSGSTVTRSADVASMTGTNFSSWYNNNEGSLFFTQKTSTYPTNSTYYYLINSGSTVNGYRFAVNVLPVDISGVSPWPSASWLALYPGSTFQNMAFAYTDGSAATAKNGAILETNTEALADVSPTLLRIAYNVTSTISRITYYPTRLSNATLQALTL
jgi:hypothetical protein